MARTAIQFDDNVFYARSETVTTWTDDDGVQWVLFVPTNGYNPGRGHRVRTDRVVIVELDEPAETPQVSQEVDVVDYRIFAQCAREAGLDTLLLSDGFPYGTKSVARVTGPRETVDAFLEAAASPDERRDA